MNLKEQTKSQIQYSKTHIGKTIGIGAGIATGVVYGMTGKKDVWVISGFAVAGALAGAILGGLFDNSKNSSEAMSNAIGAMRRGDCEACKQLKRATDLSSKANAYVTSGGVKDSNDIGAMVVERVVPDAESNVAPKVDNFIAKNNISRVTTLVRPITEYQGVGSVARQQRGMKK